MVVYITCLNRYDRMWHENGKEILKPPNCGPKKYMGMHGLFTYLVCAIIIHVGK